MPEDFWIGALFVLVAAADRFNTPQTNRSSTTIVRFYLAAACYVAVGLLSYLLLVNFPRVTGILSDEPIAQLGKYLTQPMLVALFLTVLLPKIPVLSDGDEWIRMQLQKMGAIPFEARRLSAELRRAEFRLTLQQEAEIKRKMLDEGFAPEDIQFDGNQSLQFLWTKISALIQQLEEWESDRRFVGFMARFAGDFEQLKTRYRRLSRKAKGCFRLVRNLSQEDGTVVHADEMVLHYQNDFSEQCADLFRSICDFISRGLLQCGPTYGARASKLFSLGFHVRHVRPPLTLNQLMLVFGLVGISILASFVLMPRSGSPRFEDLLAKAAMISVIYSVAVMCAVYPKEKWHFARRDPNDVRPVAFYLLAGTLAVALGSVISFLFNSFIFGSFSDAFERLTTFSYPWLTISFAAAFTTAWLLDDKPTEQMPRDRLRWLEAVALALVLVIATSLARYWLLQSPRLRGSDAASYSAPDLAGALVLAAAVGLVIGYCVPTWYREAPRAKESSEAEIADGLAYPALP